MRIKSMLSISFCILALCLGGCQGSAEAEEAAAGTENSQTETATEEPEDTEEGQEEEDSDSAAEDPVIRDIFAMDTYMTLTIYGENAEEAADAASEEIQRLDTLLSAQDETGEVYVLNQQGGGEMTVDVEYLVDRSLDIWEETDGTYDITIYPLKDAWGFNTEEYRVPEEDEIAELLTLVDSSMLQVEDQTLVFGKEGMQIDLGGIAKGYAGDQLMNIYQENGVTSGLASLGGDVHVLGSKPDGSPWRVAIEYPWDTTNYLGILEMEDMAIVTSGGYERYFEEDGVVYQHIIDPFSGYPADAGLTSVSVISEDGTLADGLSTALYVMGLDDATAHWQAHSDEYDMILMDNDEMIYVTEGIADQFTSEYPYEVIEKEK